MVMSSLKPTYKFPSSDETTIIRVDNLSTVVEGFSVFKMDNEKPIWTTEFCNWLDLNSKQLVNIHSQKDYATYRDQIFLEFKESADATIFALQFAS